MHPVFLMRNTRVDDARHRDARVEMTVPERTCILRCSGRPRVEPSRVMAFRRQSSPDWLRRQPSRRGSLLMRGNSVHRKRPAGEWAANHAGPVRFIDLHQDAVSGKAGLAGSARSSCHGTLASIARWTEALAGKAGRRDRIRGLCPVFRRSSSRQPASRIPSAKGLRAQRIGSGARTSPVPLKDAPVVGYQERAWCRRHQRRLLNRKPPSAPDRA